MAVGLEVPEALLPVVGVTLATASAGIKYQNHPDVVLMALAEGTTTAAVFTKNAFCAAPVTLAKAHLFEQQPRLLLINSGNANAGTGEPGMQVAQTCCAAMAAAADVPVSSVLPFSTGVIGLQLPADKITSCAEELVATLANDNWVPAANAIMTTDTVAKGVSKQVNLDEETVTITGICKGSGMICPDMATMLAYVATDAKIDRDTLQRYLNTVNETSFNAITVDGDTSTNDACLLMATGSSGVKISSDNESSFLAVLGELMQELAQSIIRDAEGATKFITINVTNAMTDHDAREVADTIAHSPLVKTAFFASDPNWGRILAAIGRAKISNLDVSQVSVSLNDTLVVEQNQAINTYTEEAGQQEMNKDEICIGVNLNQGASEATIWTSDLSYDYVKINSDYRS